MSARSVIVLYIAIALGITAGPAAAAPDPTIRTVHKTGVSASPFQHRYNLRLPVIVGANRKVTRKFTGHVNAIIDGQMAFLRRWRDRLGQSPDCNRQVENSSIRSRTHGQTMAGRYVSVAVEVSTWPACGGVDQVNARTFNINLSNGHSLYLDRLIDRQATYPVVRQYVDAGVALPNGDVCETQMRGKPTLYNWVLKPRGIQFWFDKYKIGAGYCGALNVTVPWRDLPLRPEGVRVANQVSK